MRVHGEIPSALVEAARTLTSAHSGVGDVLAWGAAAEPSRVPVAVIAQDEYSHDVVMRFSAGAFIVYDVT